MLPFSTSTGTAVSPQATDAVLVELQSINGIAAMIFWLLVIIILLIVGYFIAKIFDKTLWDHLD